MNWTALLFTIVPSTSYTHWMKCPSRACTLFTPLIIALCSVRLSTVYSAPWKAVSMVSPVILSTVSLCIQFGGVTTALCLHMKVNWSEQFPPWSSRETLKLVSAVKCKCAEVYVCIKKLEYS